MRPAGAHERRVAVDWPKVESPNAMRCIATSVITPKADIARAFMSTRPSPGAYQLDQLLDGESMHERTSSAYLRPLSPGVCTRRDCLKPEDPFRLRHTSALC